MPQSATVARALRLITESTRVVNSASASCSAGLLAVDSKGIVPVLPTGNSESLPSTDSMRITQRTGFRGIKMNLRHKLFGPSISQFASEFAIYRGFVLSQLFVYFARTGALPQNPVRRGGSSLSCAVSRKGKHFVVQRALIQRRRIVKKSGKLLYNSQI